MPTISVKGYSGQELTYENVEKVYFNSPDSTEKVPFSYGDTVENIPVTLDLAEGDQTITAPDGTLVKSAIIAKPEDLAPENVRKGKTIAGVEGNFIGDTEEVTVDLNMADGNQTVEPSAEGKVLSKVNIIKPDTLIPANIAEGVDIAGIIGTLAASSGGSVKIASGSIAGNSGAVTITHDLGVTPDFIYVFNPSVTMNTSTRNILRAAGLSATFAKSLGFPYTLNQFGMAHFPSGSNIGISGDNSIDTTNADANSFITNANDTSFVLGNSTYIALNSNTYYWMAVGGLT